MDHSLLISIFFWLRQIHYFNILLIRLILIFTWRLLISVRSLEFGESFLWFTEHIEDGPDPSLLLLFIVIRIPVLLFLLKDIIDFLPDLRFLPILYHPRLSPSQLLHQIIRLWGWTWGELSSNWDLAIVVYFIQIGILFHIRKVLFTRGIGVFDGCGLPITGWEHIFEVTPFPVLLRTQLPLFLPEERFRDISLGLLEEAIDVSVDLLLGGFRW